MRRLWYYYIYLIIVWGIFRYFVRLPEVIEELWFKPVIWLTPLFWWNLSMSNKLIMFGGKLFGSVLIGLFVGLVYFLLIRKFDFAVEWLSFDIVGVAVATAIVEELVFSGFVAGYLERLKHGRWVNLLIVGVMVSLVRLPILLFVYGIGWIELAGVLLFVGATGAINAWIRVTTNNITGSVLARVMMNLAVLR